MLEHKNNEYPSRQVNTPPLPSCQVKSIQLIPSPRFLSSDLSGEQKWALMSTQYNLIAPDLLAATPTHVKTIQFLILFMHWIKSFESSSNILTNSHNIFIYFYLQPMLRNTWKTMKPQQINQDWNMNFIGDFRGYLFIQALKWLILIVMEYILEMI